MRNRGRRSRGSDDINLTPLLDVLFVILFIVMLAGTQTQKDMQENAEESQSRICRAKLTGRTRSRIAAKDMSQTR